MSTKIALERIMTISPRYMLYRFITTLFPFTGWL